MFSKTPCTIPTTPRLPRIYRGVRGLPVGFSGATTTGSPILNLLFIDSKFYSIGPHSRHFGFRVGDFSFFELERTQSFGRTDQTIDGDELSQLFFRHPFCTSGTFRQDEVAYVGSAVVNLDLFARGNLQSEHFLHARARTLHDLGSVAFVLIPPRRVAKNVVRITGTERAHDNVVHGVRILHDHEFADFPLMHAHFSERFSPRR